MLIYVRTAVAPGDLASSEDPTGHSPVPGRTPYNLHPETLLLPETLKPRRWSGGNAATGELAVEAVGSFRPPWYRPSSSYSRSPVRLIAEDPNPATS